MTDKDIPGSADRLAAAIMQDRLVDAFYECRDVFYDLASADEAFDAASARLSPDQQDTLERIARDAAGRLTVQVGYSADGVERREEHYVRLFVVPVVVKPGTTVDAAQISAFRDALEAAVGEEWTFDMAPSLLSPFDLHRASKTSLRGLHIALVNMVESGEGEDGSKFGQWIPSSAAAGLPGHIDGVGAVGVLVGSIVVPLEDDLPAPKTFLDLGLPEAETNEFKERVYAACPSIGYVDFPMDPGDGIEFAMTQVRLAEAICLISDAVRGAASGNPGIYLLPDGRILHIAVTEKGGPCLADGAVDMSGTGTSASEAVGIIRREFSRTHLCKTPQEFMKAIKSGRALH